MFKSIYQRFLCLIEFKQIISKPLLLINNFRFLQSTIKIVKSYQNNYYYEYKNTKG